MHDVNGGKVLLLPSQRCCIMIITSLTNFRWRNGEISIDECCTIEIFEMLRELIIPTTNTHQSYRSLRAHLKINSLALRASFYWFYGDFHFTPWLISRNFSLLIYCRYKLIYAEDKLHWCVNCQVKQKFISSANPQSTRLHLFPKI